MYQFNYNITEEDYYNFNYHHLLNSPENKKVNNILKAFVFLAGVFVLVVNLIKLGVCLQTFLLPTALFILAIILVIFYDKSVAKKAVKRVIKFQKKSGKLPYSPNGTLTFDDTSISDKTPDTEEKVNYSVVQKITESETAYYIYLDAARAYILPKRLFESDEQRNNFLEFLNSKCENLKA